MDHLSNRLIFRGASEARIKGVFNRVIGELKRNEEPTCWFNPDPVTLNSIVESAQKFSTGFIGKLAYKIKCQNAELDAEEQLDERAKSTKEICYDLCGCLLAMEDCTENWSRSVLDSGWTQDCTESLRVSRGEGYLQIEALNEYQAKISKPLLNNDDDTVYTIVDRPELIRIINHLKPLAEHFSKLSYSENLSIE